MSRSASIPLLLASTLACLNPAPAWAVTTLYRCGDTYQATPCPEGKAMRIIDDRTPEQRESAEASWQAEQRQAIQLRQERLERERRAAKAPPAISGIGTGARQSAEDHCPASHGSAKSTSRCPVDASRTASRTATTRRAGAHASQAASAAPPTLQPAPTTTGVKTPR